MAEGWGMEVGAGLSCCVNYLAGRDFQGESRNRNASKGVLEVSGLTGDSDAPGSSEREDGSPSCWSLVKISSYLLAQSWCCWNLVCLDVGRISRRFTAIFRTGNVVLTASR